MLCVSPPKRPCQHRGDRASSHHSGGGFQLTVTFHATAMRWLFTPSGMHNTASSEWPASAVGHCASGETHSTSTKKRDGRAGSDTSRCSRRMPRIFCFSHCRRASEMIKYTINLARQLGFCDMHRVILNVRAGQLLMGEGKKNDHLVSFKWYWNPSN